jgi:hypothetical protein
MINYSELTIFVREVVNGSMAIGAFFVIVVFLHYTVINWQKRDITVTAAIAIAVLSFGHLIRAFSSWAEFVWLGLKWDSSLWMLQSWTWFIISGALVIVGKIMMLIAFSPYRWKKTIVLTAATLSICVPVVLAMLIAAYNG